MTASQELRQAATIMLQGTSSDVGKSLLATALCRVLAREGIRVAPFKSQNMSLNSYVTPDGKEIGRAQGLQADACGIAATTDMNPILLKPTKDMASQVVVHGKPYKNLDARAYREHYLPHAEAIVKEALARLRAQYEAVVIEGAGSPAEINLKDRDIVNMRLAKWADAPVLLVADIDRGGVFASIVGTLELLEPHERDRVQGVIINKFRGDVSLLQPGIDWLEARIGKPVLGVVPYLPDLQLEDEDSASLDAKLQAARTHTPDPRQLEIAVIRFPRISNFTDIDPLLHEPDVHVRWVSSVNAFGRPDAIILPGSKNTIEDMRFLQQTRLAERIRDYAEQGGRIIGICGGYQMLGQHLFDPEGVESEHREQDALGLFPMVTTFAKEKRTVRVSGTARSPFISAPLSIEGYEIHMGETAFRGTLHHPFAIRTNRSGGEAEEERIDGAMSADGRVWGTYIHGILHNDEWRWQWLNGMRETKGLAKPASPVPFQRLRAQALERLADHFAQYVDLERIYAFMNLRRNQ